MDYKSLSLSSFQTDYMNLDHSERAKENEIIYTQNAVVVEDITEQKNVSNDSLNKKVGYSTSVTTNTN